MVIPAAENSVSSSAYKPGDIIISHKKISVEVDNTDAEGRLVLADAVSYVQEKYSPNLILDLATLTGAVLVALGPNLIGVVGNNKELKAEIFESGERTFERTWELPIYEEHRELSKTSFADIKNTGKSPLAGTIVGGLFIERFIDKNVKWAHLDIAGAAVSDEEKFYVPKFATGRGVRLLVDWLFTTKN